MAAGAGCGRCSVSMKQAFVVVGPESSGNKVMTALLVRAGCVGTADDEHLNLWDRIEPATEKQVALMYSYPHGSEWPDLRNIYWRLTNKGYLTWILIMVRDHFCVMRSQVERRLKPAPIAEANYQRAYREIFKQIESGDMPYIMVPYESILMEPMKALQRLFEMLNLPTDNLGGEFVVNSKSQQTIRNENEKHYNRDDCVADYDNG